MVAIMDLGEGESACITMNMLSSQYVAGGGNCHLHFLKYYDCDKVSTFRAGSSNLIFLIHTTFTDLDLIVTSQLYLKLKVVKLSKFLSS